MSIFVMNCSLPCGFLQIFSLCIWNYGFDTRKAVLELIISLAAVPDKFLDNCLQMLVNNFKAPEKIRESTIHPRIVEKRNIYSELYMALHHIVDLVPLAPMMLKDVIDRRMPRTSEPKEVPWNQQLLLLFAIPCC